MASQFLVDLVTDLRLSDTESAVLLQAGVQSAEDVDSLLSSFPSLGTPPGAGGPALQVARISNAVALRVGASYTTARGLMMAAPPSVGFGAQPPPRSVMTLGTQIGMPAPALPAVGAPPTSGGNVDLRLANWPVKDQGQRGTCVAFGTAACFEHHMGQPQPSAPSDQSEQFLYWAIKTAHDPYPNKHGTWLRFARDGLRSHGICRESRHPYQQVPSTMIAGPNPSNLAMQDAAANKHAGATQVTNQTAPRRGCLPLCGAETWSLHLSRYSRTR